MRMLLKFGVIRCLPVPTNDAQIFVSGSCSELGNWDLENATKINVYEHCAENVPSFWTGTVSVDVSSLPFFCEYKFISRITLSDSSGIKREFETEWEGQGKSHNRRLEITTDSLRDRLVDNVYHTPASHWIPASGVSNETVVLTAFAMNLIMGKFGSTISYNAVTEKVILGKWSILIDANGNDLSSQVYVHCNAGIGRSAAMVAAYLHYIKQMSLAEIDYFLHAKRPVVFMNRYALIAAKTNFDLLFPECS